MQLKAKYGWDHGSLSTSRKISGTGLQFADVPAGKMSTVFRATGITESCRTMVVLHSHEMAMPLKKTPGHFALMNDVAQSYFLPAAAPQQR